MAKNLIKVLTNKYGQNLAKHLVNKPGLTDLFPISGYRDDLQESVV